MNNKEILKQCAHCKKKFPDSNDGKRKFCSIFCYRKSRPGKKQLKCKNLKCGKIFSADAGRKYCSEKCMYSDKQWVNKQRNRVHPHKQLYANNYDVDDSCTLIFEGPDGSGKSNIALEFSTQHPEFPYFKIKKEKLYITTLTPDEITVMHLLELSFFVSFTEQVRYSVVMDRSYPSELVYGKLFRGLTRTNEKKIYAMDKRLSKTNTKIVICWKKNKLLHDDIFSDSDLKKIKHGYREFISKTNIRPKNILLLDTSDENLEEQLKKIERFVYE